MSQYFYKVPPFDPYRTVRIFKCNVGHENNLLKGTELSAHTELLTEAGKISPTATTNAEIVVQ